MDLKQKRTKARDCIFLRTNPDGSGPHSRWNPNMRVIDHFDSKQSNCKCTITIIIIHLVTTTVLLLLLIIIIVVIIIYYYAY